MGATPKLITDTVGDAGHTLITPYTEEAEVRSWLDAAYGNHAWLRANLDEETAAGMIEAIEAVINITSGHGTGEQREHVSSYLGLKIEDITEWDSGVFDWRPSGSLGREITATAPDGAEVSFSADAEGDEIIAHFRVELPEKEFGRKYFSTAATSDWPVIEKYVPRDEWPTCMWAGQRGPDQRTPAPQVQAVVDKAVNDRAAVFAETYKIVLECQRSEHLGNTFRVSAIIEDGLDEDDIDSYIEPPEWLADLSDTTEGAPYEEAEERLLAKAGLPRSIVLRVDGPW